VDIILGRNGILDSMSVLLVVLEKKGDLEADIRRNARGCGAGEAHSVIGWEVWCWRGAGLIEDVFESFRFKSEEKLSVVKRRESAEGRGLYSLETGIESAGHAVSVYNFQYNIIVEV
jgi:hypothetical protein